MKLYTFFLAFFGIIQAIGQPVQKIKQLLKAQDFGPLSSYVDQPQKSNVDFGWETLRTIVGDYREGIIKIEEMVPSNDGTGGNFINNYRICLLTTKDKIFYYKFIKTVYKNKSSEQWEPSDETIDSIRDNSEYVSFEKLFQYTYGNPLNPNELFLTSIVYGGHCGIAGINPPYMEQLNYLLADKDVESIRQWLKSANAEKQLYAIRGYRVLLNQGYSLTDEEKRILNLVKQKTGTVSTCSGCAYMTRTFQDEVSSIASLPKKYLVPEKTSYNGNLPRKLIPAKGVSTSHNPIGIISGIIVLMGLAAFFYLYIKRGTKSEGVQQ